MKVMTTAVLALGLLVLAAAFAPPADDPQDASVRWRELLSHDVGKMTQARGPRDGAPGAAAIGFWISTDQGIQGNAVIALLDRPALGVFVGHNAPNAVLTDVADDLRLELTLHDDDVRVVAASAGGGHGLLFMSPDALDVASIKSIALMVDDTAKWAK